MNKPMKALTLWQPWASLLAIGAKKYETRSWKTEYRGPIAIHASLKDPCDIMRCLPTNVQQTMFDSLYAAFGIKSGALKRLPTGRIIATAELVGCWKMTDDGHTVGGARAVRIENVASGAMPDGAKTNIIQGNELLFGDWTPGRFAWGLANVKMLDKPIPCKGKQGMWSWEPGGEDTSHV